jgi:LysM repeat protein
MKKFFIVFIVFFSAVTLSAKLTTSQNKLSTEYTVQSGDTLYLIAKKHHTTVAEVLKANQLDLKAMIRVGQTLQVPLNTYFPEKTTLKETRRSLLAAAEKHAERETVSYTVQSGDTLFTIARAHHTSIRDLLRANSMDRGVMIKVGQQLQVPTNTYFPNQKQSIVTSKTTNPASLETTVKSSNPSPSPANAPSETYTVQSGDTLFSVARKNHIVISKLMTLNGIGLGDTLRVGQALKVSTGSTFVPLGKQAKNMSTSPVSPASKVAESKKIPVGAMPSYQVKKGDTLWKIARKHHLTLAEIRKLNKMRKKDTIRTGMVLAVGKAVQSKPKTYTVKKGDTLWLIAKKNKMSTKQLRKLNHMRRKDRIHTGTVLALSKDAIISHSAKTRSIIAKLKKKGAKKSEIEKVLAKVKRSKKRDPNISAILAQVKREKRQKQIETPLRVAKKRRKKSSRYGSAAAILNGKRSSSSRWSGSSKTIRIAKRYLGRRYVWGAVGPRSFDCSGFTQYVMRKSKGVRLPRVSRKQAYYGKYISRSHLRAGDLIFFDTSHRRRGYVNHVGIYIGNHKFIHASSARHRVVITSLNRPFYSARFKWGRRVN